MQKCMAMNWDDLRIFVAVSRAGSLSAAAAELGINQSTVSRRLAAIETSLGARLFNRRAGGSFLTAAGRQVLERAETVETEIGAIERRVTGSDRRLSGRLRVTCTDNFANRYLAPHFVRFAKAHPDISLEIITRYRHASLPRREADVAIRTTLTPPETLVGRRLFRFALAVYGAPDLVETLPPRPDPATLPWIGWRDAGFNRLMLTDHFPDAAIRHRVDGLIELGTMARAGLGVAMIGCFAADPDPGLVRVYPEPVTDAAMDLWVLTHPDLARVARVREFMRFISDAMLADRDLFMGRLA